MALIIVESPTKARTFNRILKGKEHYVFATLGHIRDLPPQEIAINYQNQFEPMYQEILKKKKVIDQLLELAKKNDEIILATDLDREGESIAYHVAYILGFIKETWPDFSIQDNTHRLSRIVFHEITPKALEEALKDRHELRIKLVEAQQARRILDRMVGYELSPLLWKKTGKNWLSAGRVQTVALRLIVEREKERRAFKVEEYFQIYGLFMQGEEFKGKLIKKDDLSYEITQKIDLYAGEYEFTKTSITKDNVESIKTDLQTDTYEIQETTEETIKRYPPPPYSTSLLQQDAFFKYGFSSKMVMRLAQDLYERGFITYHRTDSFNLSTQFVFRAKDYIEATYGKEYTLEKPRGYRTKSRMAQEAHEAIRPTKLEGENILDKSKDKRITINHKKLYKLIFARAVGTQMKEAEIKVVKIFILSSKKYLFESSSQQVLFDGFLRILNPDFVNQNTRAISLTKGSKVTLKELEPKELKTTPPYRYNEATLIRILEEKGIGRPSTYAPIISLIQEKGYVDKEGRYFMPTKLGEPISDYLSKSFPQLFNLEFTSHMEEGLDEIAEGKKTAVSILSEVYVPFKTQLDVQKNDTSSVEIKEETTEACPNCGKPLIIRYSRFGKFYACSGYPACKTTKSFLKKVAGKTCPKCKGDIVVKYSKNKKRFYGCSNYPKCNYSSWTVKGIV
ncbi:DNA topoisomerase I [Candidatus Roizmanbacteria bacterium RIFOXYB2_FULL_38_10]|uniref:DNA topoisomerase 1 n=1 Tax=Candidatus Roizmanbacteria bacterium RIFOXYD1_FULL_38_12 TaxID=1802093 RepID=A0A1F7L0L1_9BACT|nr:MAG: DNA topoisomerase I [Candidatus Roizmanbacteria bacterium RIFOXYA2_FULL_38_14]OGK63591.1 MAG: DNA topoisomerase I [Candidatus Roizmanbacteria bacterium RIFOXYA1_FULL_37_12]OGK65437.1 MAG: DNA topoisomerase I [Candidatus Roizmanbacteria bacterium RIFOXYB1_FULL_40_23]OGK69086.1 MAG: DNA topoisomerase I [Candidatus Roizmanbacteria bacterium RIFOXYB2_FULL_38_10]OGK69842.1 MAG: DNA topoisomerase I [Candidatus Roizmanbacteria bacterium RIFOXYC1_FULL_38_14]OGK73584.1 MAG: DNA topoisomerase I 